jgi:short-subunit dehydrogenase
MIDERIRLQILLRYKMTTILITGATGGIGEKISEMLAKEKYSLILLATREEALKQLSDKLRHEYEVSVETVCCDVSNYDCLKEKLSGIKKVDALINCAGVAGPAGSLVENDMHQWEKAIQVNLMGTAYTCQLLIPLLKNSRRGKIINFAGGGSAYSRKYHTAYACSKTAVVRLTETLCDEYPELDINVISPGAHKTKMWDQQLHDKEPDKWGDVDRLKDLLVFLSSPKSDHISGKFVHIYDDWDKEEFWKVNPEMYTLRRIDNQLLKKLSDNKNGQ